MELHGGTNILTCEHASGQLIRLFLKIQRPDEGRLNLPDVDEFVGRSSSYILELLKCVRPREDVSRWPTLDPTCETDLQIEEMVAQ